MKPQPACPECEKLSAVAEKSNVIGEFLEWLQSDEGYVIGYWDEPYGGYTREYKHIEKWLAEYFEIDLNKVEQERRALLEWLREAQETKK
jgi:hypothetical protein